jgi:RNA ligase (TIGR02306 family)
MTRKLATIRAIGAINEHTNANNLELASIDGWIVVVRKGEYKVGDAVILAEIDSWIPTEVAPFLTKQGKEPKEYNGIKGERLRTARLRGVVSQGLVLPISALPSESLANPIELGADVSEVLGITKFEKPLPACLQGFAKGAFPLFIPKTDQERIQNVFHTLTEEQIEDTYEVTLKLDGSSTTYFVNDGVVGVCSRNLELKIDEGNADNSFVKMFHKLGMQDKLLSYYQRTGRSIAVQAELWGSGINGNWEGISDHMYSVFDVYDIDAKKYMTSGERQQVVYDLDLEHVPHICETALENFKSVSDFLAFADRGSIHNKVCEGVVFKSITNPGLSFKVINTEYLINGGE